MQVICLQNMIHKGRRYKAGESVEMDAEQADALQFMDLVYIAPQASEKAEKAESQADTKTATKTAHRRGRKAASK